MSIDIRGAEVQHGPKANDHLVDFLCGGDPDATKIMSRYSPEQIANRPFRIASLVYQDLLRTNKALQEVIFNDNLPIHLDDVKRWIEVLSVIPEGMPFHPDIPKEVFPFLAQKIANTDTTPYHILNRAKILLWINNQQSKPGNPGYLLNPAYLHLAIADRLNDPFAHKRWVAQINAYIDLAESDLASAEDQYNRVHVEEQSFDGHLTELILYRIIAQEKGRELQPEEEQRIIRESLEHQINYAKNLRLSFESNRNKLTEFENIVWETASQQ